jgi:hypothetical protein
VPATRARAQDAEQEMPRLLQESLAKKKLTKVQKGAAT